MFSLITGTIPKESKSFTENGSWHNAHVLEKASLNYSTVSVGGGDGAAEVLTGSNGCPG